MTAASIFTGGPRSVLLLRWPAWGSPAQLSVLDEEMMEGNPERLVEEATPEGCREDQALANTFMC